MKMNPAMSDHRFHLAKYKPGIKMSCPQCGKPKCFTPYVDEEGKVSFPSSVGICDHINSCGYHYPPRQFFADHPEACPEETDYSPSISLSSKSKNIMNQSEDIISYIEEQTMKSSLSCYEINPLHKYISSVLGKKEADRLFSLYRVGTARIWNGSTIFWQIDTNGRIRGGKVMAYDPKTGHRIKDGTPKICWAHTLLKLPDFHLCQCLFGENLLPIFPSRKVAIVESEKTAIIASHFMPEYLWLATGGISGRFKSEVMEVLRGRDVTLMPDLKGFEKWSSQLPMLLSICRTVSCSDVLEKCATDSEREQGLDIADYLLMEETPEQILQLMTDVNPAIQELIEVFDLELVEARSTEKRSPPE